MDKQWKKEMIERYPSARKWNSEQWEFVWVWHLTLKEKDYATTA